MNQKIAANLANSSSALALGAAATHEVFLTLPEVCASIRLQKSWVYQAIDDGNFPHPIHLTPRRTVWRQCEIEGWKLAQIEKAVTARAAAKPGNVAR